MNFLQRQRDAGVYKTSLGLELLVPPVPGLGTDLPVVGTLGSAKVIFQGPEALDTLGKLLMSKQRNQIVFDASVTTEIDPEPLKLVGFSVGKKGASSRSLSYEFQAGDLKLSSQELQDLQARGHLSNEFVWKDGKIYRLGMSLNSLSQHSNRSGVAQGEGGPLPKKASRRSSRARRRVRRAL